jgi:hypothetical protein
MHTGGHEDLGLAHRALEMDPLTELDERCQQIDVKYNVKVQKIYVF